MELSSHNEMASFNEIDYGMIFVREMKESVLIGKKIDVNSLPSELIDDDKVLIPKGSDMDYYSSGAQHYGGFNYKVLEAIENTSFQFGYLHGDDQVDVISPNNLEHVMARLMDKSNFRLFYSELY